MTFRPLCAALLFGVSGAIAHADDVKDLAALSKAAFMEEYEQIFPEVIALQKELLTRFDADLAQTAMSDAPMSEAERAVMSCSWDRLSDQGKLDDLARQFRSYEALRQRAEADPKFDFVDLLMNAEVREEQASYMTDAALEAMTACGNTAANAERLIYDDAFWQKIGAAAAARGYMQ